MVKRRRKFTEHKEKKSRGSAFYMVVIIISLMVLSVFAIMFSSPTQTTTLVYNGQKYRQFDLGYTTEIDDKELFFFSYPSVAESLKENETHTLLQELPQWTITYDPNSSQSMDALRFDLVEYGNQYVVYGVSKPTDRVPYPIITCANATQAPLISLEISNVTEVKLENNCVRIFLEEHNTALVRDYLLYTMYGLI